MKNLEVVEKTLEEFRLDLGDEVVFEKGARLGSKKTLSFSAGEDSVFEFSQGE